MANPSNQDETIKINLTDFVSCQCIQVPPNSGTGAQNNGANIDTISITITLQSRGAGGAGGLGGAGGAGFARGAGIGGDSQVSRPAIEDSRLYDTVQKQDVLAEEPLVEKQAIEDIYASNKELDEETKDDIFEDADLQRDKSGTDSFLQKQEEKEGESQDDIFEDATQDDKSATDSSYRIDSGEETKEGDETEDETTGIDGAGQSADMEDESLEPGAEPVLDEESLEPETASGVEDESLELPAVSAVDESLELEAEPVSGEEQELEDESIAEGEDIETKEEGDHDESLDDKDRSEIESLTTKGSNASQQEEDGADGLSKTTTGSKGSTEEDISGEQGTFDEDEMYGGQLTAGTRSRQDSLISKEPGSNESSNKSIQVIGSQIDDELPDIQDLGTTDLEGQPLKEGSYQSIGEEYKTPRTSSKDLPKAKSISGVPSRKSSTKSAGAVPSKSGGQLESSSFGVTKLEGQESGELCDNCECASSDELTTSTTSGISKTKSTPDGDTVTRPQGADVAGQGGAVAGQGGAVARQGAAVAGQRPAVAGPSSGLDYEAGDELEDEGSCKPSGLDGILLRNVAGFVVLCVIIRTIRIVGGVFG